MTSIKQQRAAERIRQILSDVLLMETSDPRLAGLTLTGVEIDRELRHATIYVAAGGSDDSEKEVMKALHGAQGFLRSALAQRLNTRITPELHFLWDVTLTNAARVNDILDDLDIPDPDSYDYNTDTDEQDAA